MREKLLEGVRIRLGDLGIFAVTLESIGALSLAEFTADNIKDVNVVWRPGQRFLNLINDAEFNHVATRDAAQKTVKAQKAGETAVDITPTTKKTSDSTSGSTDSGSSDSGTDTGGTSSDTGGSGSGDLNLG